MREGPQRLPPQLERPGRTQATSSSASQLKRSFGRVRPPGKERGSVSRVPRVAAAAAAAAAAAGPQKAAQQRKSLVIGSLTSSSSCRGKAAESLSQRCSQRLASPCRKQLEDCEEGSPGSEASCCSSSSLDAAVAAAHTARMVQVLTSPPAAPPPSGVPAERCFSIADDIQEEPGDEEEPASFAGAGPLPPRSASPSVAPASDVKELEDFKAVHGTPSLPTTPSGNRQQVQSSPSSFNSSPRRSVGEASSPSRTESRLRLENEALRTALLECVQRMAELEGEREMFLAEGVFDLVNSLCKRRKSSDLSDLSLMTSDWSSPGEAEPDLQEYNEPLIAAILDSHSGKTGRLISQ
mmetsp:Transcript_93488/g.166331  ORF Transcript_93488/g.166331 Transcript_93488/m.166331 type:complete len:352 (+) Transcript_93488:100-1155(+)